MCTILSPVRQDDAERGSKRCCQISCPSHQAPGRRRLCPSCAFSLCVVETGHVEIDRENASARKNLRKHDRMCPVPHPAISTSRLAPLPILRNLLKGKYFGIHSSMIGIGRLNGTAHTDPARKRILFLLLFNGNGYPIRDTRDLRNRLAQLSLRFWFLYSLSQQSGPSRLPPRWPAHAQPSIHYHVFISRGR